MIGMRSESCITSISKDTSSKLSLTRKLMGMLKSDSFSNIYQHIKKERTHMSDRMIDFCMWDSQKHSFDKHSNYYFERFLQGNFYSITPCIGTNLECMKYS